jgi:peptide methionine sulfoxide reductase MsrA
LACPHEEETDSVTFLDLYVFGSLKTISITMINLQTYFWIILVTCFENCGGLNVISRRRALDALLVGSTAASISVPLISSLQANAVEDNDELIDVYFGCGCFWHVQHEFVEAEKRILNREDSSFTARAGYAGGLGPSDKVCYHNALQEGDYGSLGHAEVVGLRLPASSLESFAMEYFKLFDEKGNRPDQNVDRGPEYRNLIGIPGGSKSPYATKIVSASQAMGDKLDFAVGKGNDKDLRAVSFIMDTAKFPFHSAEQYHQFHDGFNLGENYPSSYNNLATKLASEGKLVDSKCPKGLIGIGVAGL